MAPNKVTSGNVTQVEHYGLYIETGEGPALVLIPDVSRERIPDLAAAYKAGDSVQVKLLRFVPERGLFKATMILADNSRPGTQYPNMRAELVDYIEDLADEDGRQAGWSKDGDEFDGAIHFLYDDSPLANAPERAVGVFLKGQAEVAAIVRLIEALELLFGEHGTAQGNAQVGPHAEWEAVKTRARAVLALLRDEGDE